MNTVSATATSAVNGYCLGGGVTLMLATDIRIAASHATFTYLARCPTGHYCPALDILPAPNGTFCAGPGLVNFTLCEPGSFQPRAWA